MIPVSNTSKLKYMATTGIVGASFAALCVYLVMVAGDQEADQLILPLKTDFRFHVYCPIDPANIQASVRSIDSSLTSSLANSSLYVVYMQTQNTSTLAYDPTTQAFYNQTQMGMFYCGLAREWNGTCEDAKIICSAPGPMFYLPIYE